MIVRKVRYTAKSLLQILLQMLLHEQKFCNKAHRVAPPVGRRRVPAGAGREAAGAGGLFQAGFRRDRFPASLRQRGSPWTREERKGPLRRGRALGCRSFRKHHHHGFLCVGSAKGRPAGVRRGLRGLGAGDPAGAERQALQMQDPPRRRTHSHHPFRLSGVTGPFWRDMP